MNSVCRINTVHDIDYEQIKLGLVEKSEEVQSDFDMIEQLFRYWRKSDLKNKNIESVMSMEYNKIQYMSGLLKDQLRCKHKDIKFHKCIGYTHGGEIFKTYCVECKYVFDKYKK